MRAFLYFSIFALLLGFTGQSRAQEELFAGTRPMGLSGAFMAIADDVNAFTWNPAGITQLNQQELTAMWTNLYNSGVIQNYLGYALPITNKLAIGIDWARIQFDDDELAYNKNCVHFALAYHPIGWLSCGFNIKSAFSSTTLDRISEGSTRNFGGDIGILFRPLFLAEDLDKIRLGIVLRDIVNTDITHEYQSKISHEEISARKVIIGLAYETPLNKLIISAETDIQLDDQFCVGGEYKFDRLSQEIKAAIRGGIHKHIGTNERPSFSFGGSLGISTTEYASVFLDYAYLDSPVLPGTHRFAIRIPFDFNPTAVEITGFEYNIPIFASLYQRYARQPAITVRVFNKQDRPVKLQISLAVKGYTPPEGITPPNEMLAKKQEDTFRLPIVLSDEILNAPQREIPITVEVTCPEDSRFKPVRKTFPMSLFPRGKLPITNREGVKPYTAFITYEDPPVAEFARRIVEHYDEPKEIYRVLNPDKMPDIRDDLNRFFVAMEIYEALRSYGVYYRPDVNESYNEITKLTQDGDGYFVDSVRYPREFLLSDDLGGDCDDWAVLYASLLESRGIETALIDVPGHIFVMFNTGIPLQNEAVIGLRDDRYIAWDDAIWDRTIWIPVDPPQKVSNSQEIDNSFYVAWEHGLQQCRTHEIGKEPEKEDRIAIVRKVQGNDYPPATLTESYEKMPESPSSLKIDPLLIDTFNMFYSEWKNYMMLEKKPANQ